jgi:hypothetical protein
VAVGSSSALQLVFGDFYEKVALAVGFIVVTTRLALLWASSI